MPHDHQFASPVILHKDTKTNIEAGDWSHLEQGAMVYATDTDEIGTYNGSSWDWTAAGGGGGDASSVTYTPTTNSDWDGDADPGDVDDALDQLAERTDDLEAASGTSTPTDIYVASNGDDANDGLSSGNPKATLQAAIDLIPDLYGNGVTIHVASGTLTEDGIEVRNKKPRDPSDYILVRGYMNETDNQFSDSARYSGTMTSGATNSFPDTTTRMTDSGASFDTTGNGLKFYLLHITGGTGYDSTDDENNWYMIEDNTSTTIDIAGRWNGDTPDSTTTYEVYKIGDCLVSGDASNTDCILKIIGSKNIVVRFIRFNAGTGAADGASGYPVIRIWGHEMDTMPHLYLGEEHPELIWIGVGVGVPANDSHGMEIQFSDLASWATFVAGWTPDGNGTNGISAGSTSHIDIRHFYVENWTKFGVYVPNDGTAILACGRIQNYTETAGFRASVCMDANSTLVEGRYLHLIDSLYGVYCLASSHAHLTQTCVIEDHGSHGVWIASASMCELNGSGIKVKDNGGWGAYAQYSSAGDVSSATYSGNSSGSYGDDSTSETY